MMLDAVGLSYYDYLCIVYIKFNNILARLITSQTIETIKNSTLPPLAPIHIPQADASDIITPTMKYGEVR
jgi:hypothetical protein